MSSAQSQPVHSIPSIAELPEHKTAPHLPIIKSYKYLKQQQTATAYRPPSLLHMLQDRDFSDVTVFVGIDSVPFHLHKAIICASTLFFRTALKPRAFKESYTCEVCLPEIQPKTFYNVVWWMYGGPAAGTSALNGYDYDIVHTYQAAEFLMMKDYRRDILIRAAQVFRQSLDPSQGVPPHYQGKKFNHPLKIMREICVTAGRGDWDILRPAIDAAVACCRLDAKDMLYKVDQPEIMSALIMESMEEKLDMTLCDECQDCILKVSKAKEDLRCLKCKKEL
ncbi:hypothetical protein AA313_de0203914 [Arthrobotrys entomopaga]|nr:hypothetical protein AA313_de0203914 [Arthrobotrys entomopaga]